VHGLDTKLAFDLLGESQTANSNGFRPASVSHRQLALKLLLYPLAMGLLKMRRFRKTT
jgi:hypothetical protein